VFSGTDAEQLLVMQLEGINTISDYARVLDYLAGLSVIETVAPLRVTPDSLQVSIQSSLGLEVIRQALAIERVLVPMQLERQGQSPGIVLHYRLTPC
jgi:hypothetical protein